MGETRKAKMSAGIMVLEPDSEKSLGSRLAMPAVIRDWVMRQPK